MSDVLRDAQGAPIDRDGSTLLGRGGEARVWGLPRSGEALKILEPSARTPERLAGLAHLVGRPRPRMLGARDDAPWGWPERLVYEGDACIGYTMRWFKKRKTLFSVVCPTERVRAFPAFDSRYVHRVGANLATALACMHDAGIVVGDLSESNVLVASDATVALVDVDSYQFEDDHGRTHPCPVGKPEFLPPEHHGEFFAETPKSPESDAFALAVLLFQMLFDGPHPFSGVHRGAGTPPTIGEAILAGDYVFAQGSALGPRLGMPGPTAVGEEVRKAFARTFVEGLHRPKLRTTAREWAALLSRAEADLVRCVQVPAHRHPRGARCAWCERRSAFGRAFETFTMVPEVASEAIAIPAGGLDGAPPTQRPLPRVADDESPLPPAAVAVASAANPSVEVPAAASGEALGTPNGTRRTPRVRHAPRLFGVRSRARAARPSASAGPSAAREGTAHAGSAAVERRGAAPEAPLHEPDAERQRLPRRPVASNTHRAPLTPPAAPPPTTTLQATSSHARPFGLRHALAAAAMLLAFALGRSSVSPTPTPIAATVPERAETRSPEAPRSAAVEGPRGSAVLRRESPVAEKKAPRPSR